MRPDLSAYLAGDSGSPTRLLRDVLANTDPTLTRAFEAHCGKSFINEDLEFLREVQAYQRASSLDAARRIHDTYIAADGAGSMNLAGGERDVATERFSAAGDPPPADLFDQPFHTVFHATAQGHFNKFRSSVGG